MPITKDDAVCIRHWDWSETSQTVSLFSRGHGVVRCVAKGSRREKSDYSGGLELATRGEMAAFIKREGQLSNLTAWDLQEVFPDVRCSLSAFTHAMAMLDVVHHCLEPLDPHPGVFDALVLGLRALADTGARRPALTVVLWTALDETGHRPELFADASSGADLAPLTEGAVLTFSPRAGGLVAGAVRDGPAWRVRAETVDLLRLIASGVWPDPDARDPATFERAARLLGWYFREVFGVEPPALAPFLVAPDPKDPGPAG
ncbi:MAG: DNA repair protein RecO [Phycisphaerales bacterium]